VTWRMFGEYQGNVDERARGSWPGTGGGGHVEVGMEPMPHEEVLDDINW